MSNIIKYNLVVEDKVSSYPVGNNKNKSDLKNLELDIKNKESEILDKAKKESDKIINEAKRKAELYLEEAYDKAKQIFDDSRSSGYEEGYSKGYLEGKKVADELINEANEIKKEYLRNKKTILKEIEKDVIELVVKNCEKILNKKLDEDKETIISVISKGLDNLDVTDSVTIKVSKYDYDVVELSKDRILVMASLIEDIFIKIDNKLEKGDCIIETDKGSVDVSVKSQLEEMKEILYNLLNSE